MKKRKFKLQYKQSKDIWTLKGPNVHEESPNYHKLLDQGQRTARSRSGELHVYTNQGDLKEIIDYCYTS